MTTLEKLTAWFRQPTTVAGVSTLFGTAMALVTHQITLAEGAPLLAGGIMSMLLPDNTAAAKDAQAMATDAMAMASAIPLTRAQIVPSNPASSALKAVVVPAFGLALLGLSACTTTQLQQTAAGITTGCAVASAAEAADPAFTSHNGKVVNGIAVICTDAPTAEALVATAGTGLGVVK